MTFLERAIADGYAKFSGEGKRQKIACVAVNHTERCADPEEGRFYKSDPNNGLHPVSKEASIGAIKKCHETLSDHGNIAETIGEFGRAVATGLS